MVRTISLKEQLIWVVKHFALRWNSSSLPYHMSQTNQRIITAQKKTVMEDCWLNMPISRSSPCHYWLLPLRKCNTTIYNFSTFQLHVFNRMKINLALPDFFFIRYKNSEWTKTRFLANSVKFCRLCPIMHNIGPILLATYK